MDWLEEKLLRDSLAAAKRRISAYEELLEKRLRRNERLTQRVVELGGEAPPWEIEATTPCQTPDYEDQRDG